ncbi:hypothetical protein Glove_219g164 [Diversispora epigaea]|uniref:Uncharacterized protein n=1 Tax=Diversispora epigaea TaxID=1348612 RepID=A0A397INS8_9GLOM|nr:hypothetical protein Glove_219g164 [Diversispora epigaea]
MKEKTLVNVFTNESVSEYLYAYSDFWLMLVMISHHTLQQLSSKSFRGSGCNNYSLSINGRHIQVAYLDVFVVLVMKKWEDIFTNVLDGEKES